MAKGKRSDEFAVRRWLRLGVASAGMGAALWGFTLVGPQVGTAAADPGSSSSASGSTSGPATKPSVRSVRTVRSVGESRRAQRPVSRPDTAAEKDDNDEEAAETPERADSDTVEQPQRDTSDTATETVNQPVSTPAPVPSLTGSWQSPYQRWVARSLDAWTNDSLGWIASLPTDERTKAQLEASFFTIRRTFFNQAPVTDPVQITGVLDGPVTGTLNTHDPDGDRLIYVLTRGPGSGSVQINRDGTFTYTPGADFDGVDTFRVTAIDIGFHTNLLEPLRPIGSSPARLLVNQGAVKFEFDYVAGAEYWTPERREALQRSADALIRYFRVGKAVVLSYDVEGEYDRGPLAGLAAAGSDPISDAPGFWDTVVQHKLLTGRDVNGAEADGDITWNFGYDWGLGETVGAGEYDFPSTAMHELLHSFGFLSAIGPAGANDGRTWMQLDRFVVTAGGVRPTGRNWRWNNAFDGQLSGDDGGLYFAGRHAEAAYGGYVPLFYPAEWEDGSSAHHTDDLTFTGSEQLLMNAKTGTGLGIRVVSAIEIGILRDLGYTMVPVSEW